MASGPSFLLKTFGNALPTFRGPRNYQQLSQEDGTVVFDAEARPIALPLDYEDKERNGEEGESLLASGISRLPKRPKKLRSCGLNWFWKTVGALVSIVLLFLLGRFIFGRFFGRPEAPAKGGRPVYSESLGCHNAPFIYNSSSFSLFSPMGKDNNNHVLDIKGLAVGTISLARGDDDLKEVMYEITIRTNDEERLDGIHITQPHITDDSETVLTSRLMINTGFVKPESEDSCVRFDIVLYMPPSLEKIHVASHAAQTHVRFDPDVDMEVLKSLFVTLYSTSSQNLILPHERLRSPKMSLEVFNGWIVGDILVHDDTKIKTQRGHGVTDVKVHASGSPSDTPASLYTVTGGGRTDIEYVGGSERRAMRNVHLSTDPDAKMFLKYSDAAFSGRIEMGAPKFESPKIQPLESTVGIEEHDDSIMHRQWTHYYNDVNGPDELNIDSRGWAALDL
ncbi:hypothetical protein DL96DRAFT_1602620 [Flagelloscypha sp. PMI_526]|nr:hypothetical protein DL96DRAFT_1602620 [Flagelloscypha sp. PMI_526]